MTAPSAIPSPRAPLRRRGARLSAVVATLALAWSGPVAAQGVPVPALKAAFLYNFVKFAEWPSDVLPPGAPLVLCVIGDEGVAESLEALVKGRNIDGHELSVRRMKADGPLRSCHVLYASGLDSKRSIELIDALKGAAVLTVSDLNQFAQRGGVAEFFIDEGKMRFAINAEAGHRAHVGLSSKLLSLAKLVKDDRDANR